MGKFENADEWIEAELNETLVVPIENLIPLTLVFSI